MSDQDKKAQDRPILRKQVLVGTVALFLFGLLYAFIAKTRADMWFGVAWAIVAACWLAVDALGSRTVIVSVKRPRIPPFFRSLALVCALVCFVLAAVFGIGPLLKENRWLTVWICFFVGIFMLFISRTGYWPRPKE